MCLRLKGLQFRFEGNLGISFEVLAHLEFRGLVLGVERFRKLMLEGFKVYGYGLGFRI